MKLRIQIKILAVALIFLAISCNKKLDQYPDNSIVTETFWKTANDAKLGLAGCYANVTNIAYDYWYMDGATDNSYDQYPWESNATYISAGTINPGQVNGVSNDYNNEYANIRTCNTFLDNIGKVTMGEDSKKEYIGEVRFLRAFDYFLLTKFFGGVPLITNTNSTQDTLAPTTESKVVNFIKSELDSAAALLPADPANAGHASKGAAWALKARVELIHGDWANAASDAQKVMDMNKYSLFKVASVGAADYADDYSNLVTFASDADKQKFYMGLRSYQNMYFSTNEGNLEFIFECQFSAAAPYEWGGLSNGLNTLLSPADLNGWSSMGATQSLVDAYWNIDGSIHTPQSQSTLAQLYNFPNTPKPAYFNQFKNRDPRFYASIFYTGNQWNAFSPGYSFTWGGTGNSNSGTGYNFRKLVDPAFATGPQWQASQSYPLIRYAEVLLTYAEAKNEASGPDATVYAALDSIRSRAGMPFVNQATYGTQSSLRELIHNERRIELAGEGFRYSDIRRWNIAAQVMTNVYDVTNSLAQPRSWQDIYKKLPYPQSAVDNNPELEAAQKAKGY